MSTDSYKQVLFNDGEGITHTDLNNVQRFFAAKLSDQILGSLIGTDSITQPEYIPNNAATKWAYCLDVCGAIPIQGSANNKLKISAGTLFQKISNSSGNGETLLAFRFDGTTEFTIANGDPSNPRVDMLQMKLELENGDSQSRDFEDGTTHVVTTQSMNKQYRIKATLSVKTGTPAASPAYPVPDTGYVPICCVVVGTSYAAVTGFKFEDTAGASATIHDLRMPVVTQVIVQNMGSFLYDPAIWSRSASDLSAMVAGSTTGSSIAATCPILKCRFVGVRPNVYQDTTFPAGYVGKIDLDVFGGHVPMCDASDQLGPGAAAKSNAMVPLITAQVSVFNVGPTVDTSSSDYMPPIWGNGKRCYNAQPDADETEQAGFWCEAVTNFELRNVTFYVATGI